MASLWHFFLLSKRKSDTKSFYSQTIRAIRKFLHSIKNISFIKVQKVRKCRALSEFQIGNRFCFAPTQCLYSRTHSAVRMLLIDARIIDNKAGNSLGDFRKLIWSPRRSNCCETGNVRAQNFYVKSSDILAKYLMNSRHILGFFTEIIFVVAPLIFILAGPNREIDFLSNSRRRESSNGNTF